MRCSIERDVVNVGDVHDPVRALSPGVVTGHDIAAQVDRDVLGPVHAAFLAEGQDRAACLQGGEEISDPLVEVEGLGIGNEFFKDRAPQGMEIRLVKPPCPQERRGVLDINHALERQRHIWSQALLQPGLNCREIMDLRRQHGIDADMTFAFGQQRCRTRGFTRLNRTGFAGG